MKRLRLMFRLRKFFVPVLLLALLAGCAPNDLSIRTLYSRLDNTIYKNTLAYADFTPEQREWIKSAAREFQLWHRENELPAYAELTEELASRLEQGNSFTREEVLEWFDTLEGLSDRSYVQLPLSRSVDVLTTLTDEQVAEIEAHMQSQSAEQLTRIQEQESTGSNAGRIERLEKSLSRMGLSLNDEQRQIVDRGMNRYEGSRTDRIAVWGQWQEEFVSLLKARNDPGFADAMESHIAVYRAQMEIQYPDRTRRNTENAAQTVAELFNSITPDQREEMIKRLRKTGDVLAAMATSEQTTIL